MFELHPSSKVTCYGYRTADVGDVFLRLPRESTSDLESRLSQMAEVLPDNHVVYEVTDILGGDPFYIKCSDFTVSFGRTCVQRRW